MWVSWFPEIYPASTSGEWARCALLPFLDQLLWVNWFPEIYHDRRSGECGLPSLILPFPPFPAAFLVGRLLSGNLRKLVDNFRSLETGRPTDLPTKSVNRTAGLSRGDWLQMCQQGWHGRKERGHVKLQLKGKRPVWQGVVGSYPACFSSFLFLAKLISPKWEKILI